LVISTLALRKMPQGTNSQIFDIQSLYVVNWVVHLPLENFFVGPPTPAQEIAEKLPGKNLKFLKSWLATQIAV